ncbi:DUF6463 family protein [Micromonospora sp. NPDC000018]|uniref:DUF6463 family protein n=1 Tax=Micromonospora sp. NPDC000018 TaxID=3154239 RepID=UPI00331D6781
MHPIKGLNRWTLGLTYVTAALHFVWAFAMQEHGWAGIARDGFYRAVTDEKASDFWLREASVWFLLAGVTMLAMGTLVHRIIRLTGRMPAQFGWYMLVLSVPLCVLYFPTTGGWPVLAIGVLGLLAARRHPEPAVGRA